MPPSSPTASLPNESATTRPQTGHDPNLVVDDDPQILGPADQFQRRGYDVDVAADGAAALDAAERPPNWSCWISTYRFGRRRCRRGLVWTAVPIVLSGRVGSSDKVAAFDAGADDYVTKPFGIEELLARITPSPAAPQPTDEARITRRWTVNLADRSITDGGQCGPTHTTEWHLLEILIRSPAS
jgi:two-component system KDP operon response regulator KdpE